MDLSNSVIMPREDFYELQAAANESPTFKDRAAGTAQGIVFMTTLTGAVIAGSWGVSKAVDWLEERRLRREFAKQDRKHQ